MIPFKLYISFRPYYRELWFLVSSCESGTRQAHGGVLLGQWSIARRSHLISFFVWLS